MFILEVCVGLVSCGHNHRNQCKSNLNGLLPRTDNIWKAAGDLIDRKPPSRTALAIMEQRGCAKLDGAVFDINWDHQRVEEWLEGLFPRPFDYARTNIVTRRPSRPQPLWVLLSKEGGHLSIVPTLLPSGKDLHWYKGREKCSTANSHVYIGNHFIFLLISMLTKL